MADQRPPSFDARRRLLRWAGLFPVAAGLGFRVNAGTVSPDQASFDTWVDAPGTSASLRRVRGIIRAYFLAQPPDATLAQKRAARIALYADHIALPGDLHYTPVATTAVRGEWSFIEGNDTGPVVYYLHGGGYGMGSAQGWRAVGAVLGRTAGMRTFSLDYRLAPEHPYPAAVDDAVAGYRWLLAQGIAPERIAMAGDSAGGGLALACLLRARDEGLPLPAAAFLMSPWTDLTMQGPSIDHPRAFDPFNRRKGLEASARQYLAGHDPKDPLVSPLFANLKGLPPLLVHVGDDEAYLDDTTSLVRAAGGAGVSVRLRQWPDMFHVWHAWAPLLPEAREAMADAAAFLRQATGVT